MDAFEIGQRLGNLDARCARVERVTSSMDEKLDAIVVSLAEKRGERKVFIWLATAAGGLGSIIVTIIVKMWSQP